MNAKAVEPAEPTPSAASPAAAKPDRTLLAVLIAVGLLVVIALAVVLARSAVRETFDEATPEGVVQRYAQAVIDGDDDAAAEYLAARADECKYYYEDTSVDRRLTFRSSDISGGNATVSVTVSTSYGGVPFTSYQSSYDTEFRLTKVDGTWLIKTAPYEFISCGVAVVK